VAAKGMDVVDSARFVALAGSEQAPYHLDRP
jgi:hypothetical protein